LIFRFAISRISLAFFALTLSMGMVSAQEEQLKDHPSIPGFPGYAIDTAKVTEFDSFEFPLEENNKAVEGKFWQITYQIKEGARKPSELEVVRNYENQFKARGGRMLYMGSGSNGATMMMPLGKGERWLNVSMVNGGDAIVMTIVETAEMKQKIEFSADEMAEQLAASGTITLHGILFDTAKTEIKPESNPVLDEVASLLKKDTSLRLKIGGHTDNIGAKAANLTLSKGRAAAVKAALVSRGVAADRLAVEGFGDTKPVANNGTEEGRSQNRRVELVKQ
jgi:outer membrane protein OmpA-like peptidoglycan-associated protein